MSGTVNTIPARDTSDRTDRRSTRTGRTIGVKAKPTGVTSGPVGPHAGPDSNPRPADRSPMLAEARSLPCLVLRRAARTARLTSARAPTAHGWTSRQSRMVLAAVHVGCLAPAAQTNRHHLREHPAQRARLASGSRFGSGRQRSQCGLPWETSWLEVVLAAGRLRVATSASTATDRRLVSLGRVIRFLARKPGLLFAVRLIVILGQIAMRNVLPNTVDRDRAVASAAHWARSYFGLMVAKAARLVPSLFTAGLGARPCG